MVARRHQELPVDPAIASALGRLLGRTHKIVRAWGDRLLEPYDATVTEWIVLHHISAAEPPGLSQIELARHSDMGGPALVRHLDRLEADGIVERRRDAEDRRIMRVALTSLGTDRYRELRQVMEEADRRLRDQLTAAEQDALEGALAKLFDFAVARLDEEECP